MQWSFNFGPGISPEEIKAQQEAQQKATQEAIDNKKCIMCDEAIFVNDQVAFCNAKGSAKYGECVDEHTGANCAYWKVVYSETKN